MIDYLEQLEHDLVAAIDARNDRAPARWRRRPRISRRAVVAVVAIAAVAGLAIVLVLAHHAGGNFRTPPPPPAHRAPPKQRPPRVPPHATLEVFGDLTRIGPTTWRGQAQGPGQTVGTLTITGETALGPRRCCDGPENRPSYARHTLRFTWTFGRDQVRGCVVNDIYRRPFARFVWDGVGRVTSATGSLARYRGRGLGFGGVSAIDATDRAHLRLRAGQRAASC